MRKFYVGYPEMDIVATSPIACEVERQDEG
jgi:hypothetical protein